MKVHSIELTNVAVSRMNCKIALVLAKKNFFMGIKEKNAPVLDLNCYEEKIS